MSLWYYLNMQLWNNNCLSQAIISDTYMIFWHCKYLIYKRIISWFADHI